MKALSFKIPKTTTDALIVQEDRGATFYDAFHQHEEIQISWVISGEGSLIVGDTVSSYQHNDIFIFGSNVPHVLKSSSIASHSHMISLFFTRTSFGDDFFDLSEFDEVRSFFDLFPFGIRVLSEKENLKKMFLDVKNEPNKLERLLIFLQMLKILSQTRKETISSSLLKKKYSDNEGKRMAQVFQLVMNEFYRDITLEEVAKKANMTKNAFCRYFKKRTNKTFFEFLTEIRIENSCLLLSKEPDISIAEASYKSGFKNLSHFNRKFKKIKKNTPTEFRKKLW